jgi:hypothetical protein
MAGAVIDLERLVAERDRVAVLEPAVRLERLGMPKAESPRLLGQLLDPEAFLLLRPLDRNAELAR